MSLGSGRHFTIRRIRKGREQSMQTVLIIDDQELSRMILNEFIRSIGPYVEGKTFETLSAALEWAEKNPVAMVLVDYRMPSMNGIEFTRRLHDLPDCRVVPVVMITALDDHDKEIRYEALSAGVVDFLLKPLDQKEWQFRCRNILNLSRSQRQDALYKDLTQVLFHITKSVNGRNPKRLANISRHIAEQMGLLTDECDLIERAAPLNDLGNFLVAGHLLWRPSIFCQEEREKVQGHTLAGFSLLQQGDSPLFQQGAKIALSHHEHFDGKGYPHGFGGQDIPLEARIVSVADFVDALLSDRPYRKAWSVDKMLGYLKSYRGKRFDPDCVDAFFERLDRILLSETSSISRSPCLID
ncbi:MAG: response regulator [gamma proteobacterium endosymbiont of Lamellibrachia anaximandri]|nr:response regulator [gamma proteobacterium endosymbiont of Lamellibrachia anaximandri]